MRGDDDIFLSDDEKVQAALKQLDRLAEDCQSILEEDSVTVSHTLQSSATNAEEYDEAAEEEIEDMHGCLRRCLHGGFPQFMGQEPPPTSSCPCYNCCMASLTPEFSEVTHEGDHEENDNAGIDDEREEGMHDADNDVEEEASDDVSDNSDPVQLPDPKPTADGESDNSKDSTKEAEVVSLDSFRK